VISPRILVPVSAEHRLTIVLWNGQKRNLKKTEEVLYGNKMLKFQFGKEAGNSFRSVADKANGRTSKHCQWEDPKELLARILPVKFSTFRISWPSTNSPPQKCVIKLYFSIMHLIRRSSTLPKLISMQEDTAGLPHH